MSAATMPQGEVTIKDCPCGKVHCFDVAHYDRVIVTYGRRYWALQPRRNGPLQMFPWPGPNISSRELAVIEGTAPIPISL